MKKQQIAQKLIRFAERAVSTAFMAVLLLLLFFAVYVTAENRRIMAEASAQVYQSYKPTADDTVSFHDLVEINPDVIAWLTIDATNIDYPLVQGESNSTYLNKSATGEFSLGGALFLDYRNAPDFSDPLSIVYGHNMTGGMMFGGITRYADPDYFNRHRSGTLYCGGTYYKVEIFAYFAADGHDNTVYAPRADEERCRAWLAHIGEIAVNRTEEFPDGGPILLMSTCAAGQTNQRNLLAAAIRPGGKPMKATETHTTHTGTLLHFNGPERSPWPYLISAGVALAAFTALYILWKRKRDKKHGE